jgi:hypothetical protein
MELSDRAQKKRRDDMNSVYDNSCWLDRLTIIVSGLWILLRWCMANQLPPAQRKALYALAVIVGGSLVIVAREIPALAIVIGFLIGVLVSEIRKL